MAYHYQFIHEPHLDLGWGWDWDWDWKEPRVFWGLMSTAAACLVVGLMSLVDRPWIVLYAGLVFFVIWPLSLYLVYRFGESRKFSILFPLSDRGHQLLDFLGLCDLAKQWSLLSDLGVHIWNYIILAIIWSDNDPQQLTDFLLYLSTVLLFRCVCFSVTVLPDASQRAHLKTWLQRIFTGGVFDLMFSGHVAFAWMPYFFSVQRGLVAFWPSWLHLVYYAQFTIVCLIAVASHNHYTVDVILVFPACSFVYSVLFGSLGQAQK